jgi:hypothetical protein
MLFSIYLCTRLGTELSPHVTTAEIFKNVQIEALDKDSNA